MGFSNLKIKSLRFWWLGFMGLAFGVFCALGAIEFFLTPDDRVRGLVRQVVGSLVDGITHAEGDRLAQAQAQGNTHLTPPYPLLNPHDIEPLLDGGWVVDITSPSQNYSPKPQNLYHITLTLKDESVLEKDEGKPVPHSLGAYSDLLTRAFRKIKLVPLALDAAYGKFVVLVFRKKYQLKDQGVALLPEEKHALENTVEFSTDLADSEVIPHLSLIRWATQDLIDLPRYKEEYLADALRYTEENRVRTIEPFLQAAHAMTAPKKVTSKAPKDFRMQIEAVYTHFQRVKQYLYLPPVLVSGNKIDLNDKTSYRSLVDPLLLRDFKDQLPALVDRMGALQPRLPARIHYQDLVGIIGPITPIIAEFNAREAELEAADPQGAMGGPAPAAPLFVPQVYTDEAFNIEVEQQKGAL